MFEKSNTQAGMDRPRVARRVRTSMRSGHRVVRASLYRSWGAATTALNTASRLALAAVFGSMPARGPALATWLPARTGGNPSSIAD